MTSAPDYAARIERLRAEMASAGVDVTLLSVGPDLPYFTGYEAMPLERLTMLVVGATGDPKLVIPGLEAPRVDTSAGVFELIGWGETTNPAGIVAGELGRDATVAIGDHTWARFMVEIGDLAPGVTWRRASTVTSPIRSVKDTAELDALREASAAVDRIAAELQAGRIPLVGRTEAEVSADLGRRIIAEGHRKVNFAIVAAGENASSPHHEPGERVIAENEVVLCDFGGTMGPHGAPGYCSDITRCVYTGEPSAEFAELYAVLFESNAAGVAAATVGTPCEDVDAAARKVIDDAGYGEYFVHRTGHGIGTEAHEDPYIVSGNETPLEAGHCFSIEPGIYVPGRFGARLEDIVAATDDGPDPLNMVDHNLAVVSS